MSSVTPMSPSASASGITTNVRYHQPLANRKSVHSERRSTFRGLDLLNMSSLSESPLDNEAGIIPDVDYDSRRSSLVSSAPSSNNSRFSRNSQPTLFLPAFSDLPLSHRPAVRIPSLPINVNDKTVPAFTVSKLDAEGYVRTLEARKRVNRSAKRVRHGRLKPLLLSVGHTPPSIPKSATLISSSKIRALSRCSFRYAKYLIHILRLILKYKEAKRPYLRTLSLSLTRTGASDISRKKALVQRPKRGVVFDLLHWIFRRFV